MSLLEFRKNVYSQNGEDGILLEILRRIGSVAEGRWCVEFGAWDGKHLSNTFNLVNSYGWNAIYIEGDAEKFRDLRQTATEFRKIHPILSWVGRSESGGSTLDELLSKTEIPLEYDLLSVDIDSTDLEVWADHTAYQPKVVVIEINSAIPPGLLQWHSEQVQGNSYSSTLNVGRSKGYSLVCHTGNLIFVRDDLVDLVGLDELDRLHPERLFLWDWVLLGNHKSLKARIAAVFPSSLRRMIKKIAK